jgi:hypothetical protein
MLQSLSKAQGRKPHGVGPQEGQGLPEGGRNEKARPGALG